MSFTNIMLVEMVKSLDMFAPDIAKIFAMNTLTRKYLIEIIEDVAKKKIEKTSLLN